MNKNSIEHFFKIKFLSVNSLLYLFSVDLIASCLANCCVFGAIANVNAINIWNVVNTGISAWTIKGDYVILLVQLKPKQKLHDETIYKWFIKSRDPLNHRKTSQVNFYISDLDIFLYKMSILCDECKYHICLVNN